MWIYVWLMITATSLILEFITTDMLCIWFAGGAQLPVPDERRNLHPGRDDARYFTIPWRTERPRQLSGF